MEYLNENLDNNESFGQKLTNAFDPEMYNPGSFGRFASNVVGNVSELLGTDEQTNARNLEIKKKSDDYLKYLQGKLYIPDFELPEYEQAHKEWAMNTVVDVPGAASIKKIKYVGELPQKQYHVSPYEFEKFDMLAPRKGTIGYGVQGSGSGIYTTPQRDWIERHSTQIRNARGLTPDDPIYLYTAKNTDEAANKIALSTSDPLIVQARENPEIVGRLFDLGGYASAETPTYDLIRNATKEMRDRYINQGMDFESARWMAQDAVNRVLREGNVGAQYIKPQGSEYGNWNDKILEILTLDDKDVQILDRKVKNYLNPFVDEDFK